MQSTAGRHDFSWDDLGDLKSGRPNLGPMVPVLVYRLLEYTHQGCLVKRIRLQKKWPPSWCAPAVLPDDTSC